MLSDLIKADIDNVFFNSADFAEEHELNGLNVMCIVDNDALNRRTAQIVLDELSSIGKTEISIFIATASIAKKLMAGSAVIFDGRQYVINNLYENDGITELMLEQNRNI